MGMYYTRSWRSGKEIGPLIILAIGIWLTGCHAPKEQQEQDWPVYLGSKASTHYSPLDEIDTTNVNQLEVAWVYHTGDADTASHSQIQCNPIEVGGILYGTSPQLKLFALDAGTGAEKWTFDPYADARGKEQINVNRGVTYWAEGTDKRIFYGAGAWLYGINATTGKPLLSFGDSGRVNLRTGLGSRDSAQLYVTSTSPGIIYQDLLIIGTRVAESNPAAPGDIRAYDVRTGALRWVFHTIPHPGEAGYDSWEDTTAWKHTGGANNWAGMSLDEKRGIVFVPLGSATYDFYGGLRKGQNLFANCLLALRASTGKLLWYDQTVHHDLWDRDLPAPPNLVTIQRNGKSTDAVAQVTKTGFVFVFHRETGEPIFKINEVPVPDSPALPGEQPWPTQPVPEHPKPFVKQRFTADDINDLVSDSEQAVIRAQLARLEPQTHMFQPPSERGTVIFPGFDGGAEWGGAAYDPTTGLLYVNANQIPWSLTMVKNKSGKPVQRQTVAERGKVIYFQNCMTCHGANREGGGDYPSLQHLAQKLSPKEVLELINSGRRRMPAFKQIAPDDKAALLAFLLDLKEGNLPFTAAGNDEPPAFMPYTMTGYKKMRTAEGYPASKSPWGTLTAIDLNTAETMWQIPLGTYPELERKGIPTTGRENYGGPVVTAGGLLFIAATADGKIRAFNKRTGKLLWERDLPASGFATPATYKANGKQYLVIACGGGKLDQQSGDVYVAFALH